MGLEMDPKEIKHKQDLENIKGELQKRAQPFSTTTVQVRHFNMNSTGTFFIKFFPKQIL